MFRIDEVKNYLKFGKIRRYANETSPHKIIQLFRLSIIVLLTDMRMYIRLRIITFLLLLRKCLHSVIQTKGSRFRLL